MRVQRNLAKRRKDVIHGLIKGRAMDSAALVELLVLEINVKIYAY